MVKVITDEKQINELLDRGVEKIYPSKKEFKEKLESGERISLYCGFDPSAASLHIGNAILINKLSQFQKMGHEVIFLIGDFTGMIGDPTDKGATRKKLTREEVVKNSADYKKQAGGYLDFDGKNPALVKYNSEWSDKLSFKDLIEVSSNFTVQQMMQRDMFQKRIEEEKPIHLHEFLYPLAQAYDSVAMDVDLEIGGNDQMFNMMCGRDLMKSMGKKNKFVMTLKLLADDKGKKMGKSEGNAVFLDQEASDMYGKVMSWVDGVIGVAFELCTNIPMSEVGQIYKDMKNDSVNPRDLKMKLAFEIVKINRGEKEAKLAQEHFVNTVQKKEIPDEVSTHNTQHTTHNILDLLVESKLVTSKGDARRMIKQNAVKIDGEIISDDKMEVEMKKEGFILQKGKRNFVRIVKE
jgi:tyrosyl-tRNA synthetase